VVNVDAALGEQSFDVAVGQAVAEIPTHRKQDHVQRKPETTWISSNDGNPFRIDHGLVSAPAFLVEDSGNEPFIGQHLRLSAPSRSRCIAFAASTFAGENRCPDMSLVTRSATSGP
jgi:hypothetical protein